MKKIYLALLCISTYGATLAQTTVSIGTSLTAPSGSTYRSPWSPTWGYSYTQTIYLQSEINTTGAITSLKFDYAGASLDNSNQITVWMGHIARGTFGSTSDWEPVTNLTQVFSGIPTYSALPGIVTINLPMPFNYNNTGNLVIAIHESKPDFDNGGYFYASEVGTARTIYRVDDVENPNPANPPVADNVRTKVGNIQIVFAAPAPISLGGFTGEKIGKANKLAWTTLTEQNNAGFELERSADGNQFSAIAFVKSKAHGGNSNASLSYTFTDEKLFVGNNYYRLKQIDLDGKTTYSKVVLLKGEGRNFGISVVYPNPTKNNLNISLLSPGSEKATIYISDIAGKIVNTTSAKLVSGDNTININAGAFALGIYNIKAVYEDGSIATSKFVKQ